MKNLSFFLLFVFGEIGPEKVFVGVVNRKLACQHYKNIGLRKSQNLHFPKGGRPWFWSKIWNFFFFFFFGKISREKVFGDVLERRLAVLAYKNVDLKKSQNLHFSKRVRPWFWSKIWNFFFFSFLAKKGQVKIIGDVLDWELAFLIYKKVAKSAFFQREKICHFFFFSIFGEIGPEKVLWTLWIEN